MTQQEAWQRIPAGQEEILAAIKGLRSRSDLDQGKLGAARCAGLRSFRASLDEVIEEAGPDRLAQMTKAEFINDFFEVSGVVDQAIQEVYTATNLAFYFASLKMALKTWLGTRLSELPVRFSDHGRRGRPAADNGDGPRNQHRRRDDNSS